MMDIPKHLPDVVTSPPSVGETFHVLSLSGSIAAHEVTKVNRFWLMGTTAHIERATGVAFSRADNRGVRIGTAHTSHASAVAYREHAEAVSRLQARMRRFLLYPATDISPETVEALDTLLRNSMRL